MKCRNGILVLVVLIAGTIVVLFRSAGHPQQGRGLQTSIIEKETSAPLARGCPNRGTPGQSDTITYRISGRTNTLAVSSQVTNVNDVQSEVEQARLLNWIVELNSTNAITRSNAASSIRDAGVIAVPELLRAARLGSGWARSKAILLLGQIGGTNVCSELQQLYLSSVDLPHVDRVMILLALDDLNGARYIDFFAKELELQEDLDIRLALAIALAKRGHKSGVNELLNRLDIPDEKRQETASWYLKKLFMKDFGRDSQKWREWLRQNGKI